MKLGIRQIVYRRRRIATYLEDGNNSVAQVLFHRRQQASQGVVITTMHCMVQILYLLSWFNIN